METDNNLKARERTHIMPMGFEQERIFTPAKEFNADNVTIITHNGDKSEFDDHYRVVKERLEEDGITPKTEQCDIFDVYDSLETIGKEIASNRSDNVYVNLSAGSKVTAIAGMLACMCSEATPYYARAEDYSPPAPSNISEITSLPKYRINPPSNDQIAVLEYLENVGDSTKLELIKFGEEANLDFLADFDGKDKAKYRRLDRHIITPLGESDYIDIERDGRKRIVSITGSGVKGQRAFKHLVKTDDEEGNRIEVAKKLR